MEIRKKKEGMLTELHDIANPDGTQKNSEDHLNKTSHSYIVEEYRFTGNIRSINDIRKYYKQKMPEYGWTEVYPKARDYNSSDDLFYEKNGYRFHLYPGNSAFSWIFFIKYRYRGYDENEW